LETGTCARVNALVTGTDTAIVHPHGAIPTSPNNATSILRFSACTCSMQQRLKRMPFVQRTLSLRQCALHVKFHSSTPTLFAFAFCLQLRFAPNQLSSISRNAYVTHFASNDTSQHYSSVATDQFKSQTLMHILLSFVHSIYFFKLASSPCQPSVGAIEFNRL
jgi:hypothetical protein